MAITQKEFEQAAEDLWRTSTRYRELNATWGDAWRAEVVAREALDDARRAHTNACLEREKFVVAEVRRRQMRPLEDAYNAAQAEIGRQLAETGDCDTTERDRIAAQMEALRASWE